MKERIIAVAILILILAGAGFGGYALRNSMTKGDKNTIADLQKSKSDLENQLNSLKNIPGAVETVDGIIVPLFSKPGFSRYVSKSGLTFVFKTKVQYAQDKPESDLTISEVPDPSGSNVVTVKIAAVDDPSIEQTILFDTKPAGQSVKDYVGTELNDQLSVELVKIDPKLAVKQYGQANKALAVNSAANDQFIPVRFVEFTDNETHVATINFTENKLFIADIYDFIDSISMLK